MEDQRVNQSKCIGCGACGPNCSVAAITYDKKTGKASIDNSKCIKCGICQGICPVSAIKIF